MHPDVVRFVHLLSEPAFLASGTGQIFTANAAAAQVTGNPAPALIGMSIPSLVADPPAKVLEYLRLCSRSRQLLPGSLTLLPREQPPLEIRCDGAVLTGKTDSSPAVLFLRCRPRNETTDQFVLLNQKIVSLSKEILERRKAEQERDELLRSERAARVEAERTSRLKDEFLATLSHELRTPLNAILGWSHILLSGERDEPSLVEGLQTIERNARAQTRLIEDLLDMSRIISGKVRLDVQRVDLAAVVEAAVESVRPAAEAKLLRLQVTLDPIAGPVRGDPGRLQQVVWNLLSNAVKFTPKGGRVQVLLERINSHLEIVVSDTGEGIKPEFLPHLFERFRQSDSSTTRRHGGLGLGLSIVNQLVELHGGTVRAKSPGVGQGSTFTVILPLAVLHEEQTDISAQRIHPGATAPQDQSCDVVRLSGVRVLVVDDEPDARELVRRFLTNCDASVVTAGSADEAMTELDDHLPDVLVSDIGMPDVDGYELMRRIRSHHDESRRQVPAIALTAFARSEDRTRAMLAGFNVHLSKPIEPAELAATVGSLTGRTGIARR
ncbi:MAG TPA: ATP-binding protein [Tepidisphaeraceae bacterium]|nr:ATP-binding protein [Tepidisphaeraceae bacterium]